MSSNALIPEWQAVIDIGSNSVRLVIYDVAGRALLPHYNEKVMARLGARLSKSGELSGEGKAVAMKAIRRYHAILAGLGVESVKAVATAAVRRASDGLAFVTEIERETGIKVDIIDGAEEARLSALGVNGSIYEASGVVGDLGGSSLEFAGLSGGKIGLAETHMLGPLSLNASKLSISELQARVRQDLLGSKVLNEAGGRFYMVGGAWRALAKLHMELTEYPLNQLHAYALDGRAIEHLATVTQSNNTMSRQLMEKISIKRASALPYASVLLSEIFKIGKFHDAMVSSYGVREGVVLDGLDQDMDNDPLLDGVALAVRLHGKRREFGEALFEWVTPSITAQRDLFGTLAVSRRLIGAACLLSDSGARFHPDARAQLAYRQVLSAPYSSVTHQERAFIALAVARRYSRRFRLKEKNAVLLNDRQIKLAKRLGAAMRLGAVFSGRSSALLKVCELKRSDSQISLVLPKAQKALVSSMVERRLETLASLLDLQANIKFT